MNEQKTKIFSLKIFISEKVDFYFRENKMS